jgi:FkbM family methyltransferase
MPDDNDLRAHDYAVCTRRLASSLVERLPSRCRLALKTWHYSRLILHIEPAADLDLIGARCLIHPGDKVLDVGANVGLWTRFLSQWVGKKGRVWCFEPIPETFAILTECIQRLDLDNAIPVNVAVSDSDDSVKMVIPLDDRGIRNYHLATIVSASTPDSVTMPTVTLDQWHKKENCPDVQFIKIDTEQHELPCVRGAMRLIHDYLPALCIEISSDLSDPKSDGAAIIRLLDPMGYSIYTWDSAGFILWRPAARSVNYFFLCSDHITRAKIGNPS